MAKALKSWNDTIGDQWLALDEDAITYKPSMLGLAMLSRLLGFGGQARARYWKAGALLREEFYRNGAVMKGYERGEEYFYLSPYGRAVLVKHYRVFESAWRSAQRTRNNKLMGWNKERTAVGYGQ